MSIISKFEEILETNINAFLDKCGDSSKAIDTFLRELNDNLSQVRVETASFMSEEKKSQKVVDALEYEIANCDNEDEKSGKLSQLEEANSKLSLAKSNTEKMNQMHDKLLDDISTLSCSRK